MLIFIRVMASRTKYNDLLIEIGLTDERMCRIVTGIRSYIFGNIQKKLCSLDHEFVISESKLESYRKALQDQGNPLKGCIGFCDGTNFQSKLFIRKKLLFIRRTRPKSLIDATLRVSSVELLMSVGVL